MKKKFKKIIRNIFYKRKQRSKVGEKLDIVKDSLFQSEHQEIHNWLFSVIKKKIFSLPVSVRFISLSSFLFVFGWWLGWDTFFSIYVERIVENIFLVSMIWTLLPLSRLLFALPIGELNNNTNRKYVIFLSKLIYIICSLLYFLAGILKSTEILIFAVIFNGMAAATLFVTYESYIRSVTDKNHSEDSWWLYFSSLNTAWMIWAVIASFLVVFLKLPFLYLFIAFFSVLSLYLDNKIPITDKDKLKEILWKKSFLRQFIKKVFSIKPIKNTIVFLKNSPKSFIHILWYEWLFNILNYIGFVFIPLVAIKHDFSLSQIALIFALMRLPYVTNFFVVSLSEKFNKKLFIAVVLIFLSFLYAILWFDISFWSILVVTFGIALWLSLIRPIVSSLVTENCHEDDIWTITWVQNFVAWIGMMLGSIWFWIITFLFGMYTSFFLIGLSLFILSIWGLAKRFKKK
jgi:MFS family permease